MKSIDAFEENLRSTDLYTARIHAMSTYLQEGAPKEYPQTISKDVVKFVTWDKSHFDKIFELGFIGLFANFEYFMYDFVRELYQKNPKAIPKEKVIKADAILAYKSYKQVLNYLIDTIAIENSYDIETWNTTVSKLFNIKPMTEDIKVRMMMMSVKRNMYMHSGGKWNSKVGKDSIKIGQAMKMLPSTEKNEEDEAKAIQKPKKELPPDVCYSVTLDCLLNIIKDIKIQIEKKEKRKKGDK